MRTYINKSKGQIKGFTLIELFVVVCSIALLSTIFLSAFDRDKEIEHLLVCKKNIRQITLGVLMYADDNRNIMPWPPRNDSEGRRLTDHQVFAPGGLGADLDPSMPPSDDTYLNYQNKWAIHAESGSVFNYVTGQKKWDRDMQQMIRTVYPVYRCPSTGIKGAVLRVNYSMNKLFNPSQSINNSIIPAEGVKSVAIRNPAQKIVLVQETPESMRESGFYPGGSAQSAMKAGALLSHLGKGNIGFCDGHIEEIKTEQLLQMIEDDAKRTLYFDPTK